MISVRSLSKSFNKNSEVTRVIDSVDLEINRGEFVTIFGPNGSGKTTLLNIIAGLDEADSGLVYVNGRKPKEAKAGFVFQNYNESLFPWRTVMENVTFPLEIFKVDKNGQDKIANHLLKEVGLLDSKHKFTYELSGGQRQLVSICRAIAYEPDILLMDEPFSALDYSTTRRMELELLRVWQEKKITTLFVSHDIDESIFLADKVVVLSRNPTRVKKIFKVLLPRPRTLAMFESLEFIKLRNEILSTFEYEK